MNNSNKIICKLLPLKSFGVDDIRFGNKPTINSVISLKINDELKIKNTIITLLFSQKYDSVLLNLNNNLFVCNPITSDTNNYTQDSILYHPLQKLVDFSAITDPHPTDPMTL